MRRLIATAALVLVTGSTGYCQQGWEPKQALEIPTEQQASIPMPAPESNPMLEIPQVPKEFLGCWSGYPVALQTTANGSFAQQQMEVCFDPKPRMVRHAPDSDQIEEYQSKSQVISAGQDWVQFENHGSAVNVLHLGPFKVRYTLKGEAHIRCQSVQEQLKCEGSSVNSHEGVQVLSSSWTATLDKKALNPIP
jgi:hypothetical protein